jgi:NADP-dependent 3-hydroxy acid dehydrogenase YdfG
MPLVLKGKAALVTGASSGIGEAVALALAEAGASVAVSGRRAERLEALVGQIESVGSRGLALPSDVTLEADAFMAVRKAAEYFGRLDFLINSAGVNEAGGVGSLKLDLWRKVLDVNLMGTLYSCSAALEVMKAQGDGHIVNISSTAGRRGSGDFGAYATSKFGVTGLTESMRQEVGGLGIRVSLVEPGATSTEIAEGMTDPVARAAIRQFVSRDGTMAASNIADAVLFALSMPPNVNVALMQIRPTSDISPM